MDFDPVLVRRVHGDDCDAWREARLAALEESPSAFGSTLEREQAFGANVWVDRMRASATGDQAASFVALSGDPAKVVGMVAMYRGESPPGECQLVSMWTAPDARGAGVGARLVEACLEWAGGVTSLDRVALWVTRGNDEAKRLYERCGFTVTADVQPLPSDPCKDEIRMRMSLPGGDADPGAA